MKNDLIKKDYIPLDKSWMIRIGVLDLINNYSDCINFLQQHYEKLSDDLKSLYHASIQWKENTPIDVGESGTLYRFLRFASWKLGLDKRFILQGTLKDRKICNNPEITNWSLEQLLELDNGTSQWASASVLLGNSQRIINPPYKLQTTYEAIEHWTKARKQGKLWEPRYDETILAQALAYLNYIKTGKIEFTPEQAEDYCFARAFGLINKEAEKRWPSLRGHESDRINEMELALHQKEITSRDHRVIQAVAMLKRNSIKIEYPECVNKSWPQFWRFLKDFSLS
ncbi:hypothetical protein J4405_03255 [Candidatus Woesearchaeota archaeon]|nr:hypothetical protein [Candidatus Woesearchaeota archaeon]